MSKATNGGLPASEMFLYSLLAWLQLMIMVNLKEAFGKFIP